MENSGPTVPLQTPFCSQWRFFRINCSSEQPVFIFSFFLFLFFLVLKILLNMVSDECMFVSGGEREREREMAFDNLVSCVL